MKLNVGAVLLMVAAGLGSTPACGQDRVHQIEKVLSAPIDAYRACLFSTAKRYATETKESADVIQRVTVTTCGRQRLDVIEAFKKVGMGDKDEVKNLDRHVVDEVTLAVVDARASIFRRETMTKEEVNRLYFVAIACSTRAFATWAKRPGPTDASKIVAYMDCTSQWGNVISAWVAFDPTKTIDAAAKLLFDRWRKMDPAMKPEHLV